MMNAKGESKTYVTALRDNESMRRKLNYYRGLLTDAGIEIDPEMEHTDAVVDELRAKNEELEKQVAFWRGRAK